VAARLRQARQETAGLPVEILAQAGRPVVEIPVPVEPVVVCTPVRLEELLVVDTRARAPRR
jgi:hypothetical protein